MNTKKSNRFGAARHTTATLAVLALILAACGGNDADAPAAPAPAPAPAADAGPTAPECGYEVAGDCIADAELWAAAQAEGGLTLYSSVSEARQQVTLAAWAEAGVPLTVELVRLGGGRLYERVQTEHIANQLAADVLLHSDIALVNGHADLGVYEPHCVPNLDLIPDPLKFGDCLFQAGVIVPLLFGWNTALLPSGQAPTSYRSMLDSAELDGGKIAVQHIGVGGSSYAVYFELRKQYGPESWVAMAAKDPVLVGAAGAAQEAVVRGEQVFGPMLTVGNINVSVDDGAPIAGLFPEDISVAIGHWMGLTAQASNPNAAKVFMNWWYSTGGQEAVAFSGDYHPVSGSPSPRVAGYDVAPDVSTLVFPESDPDFIRLRDELFNEWQTVFNFTPGS